MTIVSVSRRTDIPAFYAEWFINRIHEGYVLYPLPFSDKLKYLELTPDKVDCFVFWSKNYENLMSYLPFLDNRGFNYYFHFTINNYPKHLEQDLISTNTAIEQAKKLATHKSPEHVLWRYDPIISTNDLNSNFHLYNFESLASRLEGSTKRCYVEYLDMYKKVERNFKRKSINYVPLSQEQKLNLLSRLAQIAEKYGMELFSCCNDSLVTDKIKKAHCIDPYLIGQITGKNINYTFAPTRDSCGCAKSIDIGEYGSCLHGCLYCYANEKKSEAQTFYGNCEVSSPALDTTKLNKFENQNLIKSTNKEDGQLKLF